ncbi:MAG TPA: hypothetical protein PKO28_04530 [Bacilli bacterium]|nr:hypothetical protein [Bacilli bacterium]
MNKFSEISIFQVKLDKVNEFESIMIQATKVLKESQGCSKVHLVKRTHYIKDMDTIRGGDSPDALTRAVKCVKYSLYLEFDTKENYGLSQKNLYETWWKEIDKCLIVPHDKLLGEVII